MYKLFISAVVAISAMTWHPAAITEQLLVPTEKVKRAVDLVPEAGEKDEQAAKEVLGYLLQGYAIPLSIHASCKSVGMDFHDKTIGDFTSGMLSQFVYAKGANSRNWITASCKNASASSIKKSVRDCEITFHQALLDEETLWAWGFKFSAIKHSKNIIRNSLRCNVAG